MHALSLAAEHGVRLSIGAYLAIAPNVLQPADVQVALARETLAPLSGERSAEAAGGFPREPGIPRGVGTRFKLPTKDGFKLAALYAEAGAGGGSGGRGVIAFHGNGMTLESMRPFVDFYTARSACVLLLTMRGYPGSSGDVREQGEAGMYLDAAAAVDWMLEEKGFAPQQLIAHGFSLGGSVAAAAAVHHELSALVLDHTFTSAAAVAAHVAVGEYPRIPAFFSAGVAKGVIGRAFAPGESVDLGRAGVVETDGLCTVRKVRSFVGKFVVVYGTADDIIPSSFADEFEAAAGAVASFAAVKLDGGGRGAAHEFTQFDDSAKCDEIAEALGLPAVSVSRRKRKAKAEPVPQHEAARGSKRGKQKERYAYRPKTQGSDTYLSINGAQRL
jgi:dienelactone hydrolase